MKNLPARLREKCAFDQELAVSNVTALVERFKSYPSESELFRRMEQMAREEHARLAPLLDKLIACVEALERIEEIAEEFKDEPKHYKEVIAERALSALRETVGGE